MKNENKVREEIDSLVKKFQVKHSNHIKSHYNEFIVLAGTYEDLAELYDQLNEFEEVKHVFVDYQIS